MQTESTQQAVVGWHFAPTDGKLNHDDGREITVGQAPTVDGVIILCESGLHGSLKLRDAAHAAQNEKLEQLALEAMGIIA